MEIEIENTNDMETVSLEDSSSFTTCRTRLSISDQSTASLEDYSLFNSCLSISDNDCIISAVHDSCSTSTQLPVNDNDCNAAAEDSCYTSNQLTPSNEKLHLPSIWYLGFGGLGCFLLTLDMFTDGWTCAKNLNKGRYIFGTLTLLPIILPIIAHLYSDFYKTQDRLIVLDANEGFLCMPILRTGLLDPIIWCWNHWNETRKYRKNPGREQQERFYKTKQMSQLAMKNEAQLEATLQAALSMFSLFYYYSADNASDRIVTVISLVTSTISIGRSACSDLVKTNAKYQNNGKYLILVNKVLQDMDQKLSWKLSRLASVILNTGITLMVNVTFVLYWHHGLPISYQESTLFIILGVLLMLLINTVFQTTWGVIASTEFFTHDFNVERCFTMQFYQSWIHFVIRAPLINIFRSASLFYYSHSLCIRMILTIVNYFSLFLLFAPFCINATTSALYFDFIGIFVCGVLLSLICQSCASYFVKRTIDVNDDDMDNLHLIRRFQLP